MLVNYTATRNLIAAHQPVELLTGGDFASATGWTLGTGVSIAAGVASKAAGVASNLERDIVVTEGLVYDVTYTINSISLGGMAQTIAGTAGASRTTAGTYVESIVAGADASLRYKTAYDSAVVSEIDNVSVMLGANNYDLEFLANASRVPHTNKTPVKSDDGTTQTIVINSGEMKYNITTQPMEYGSALYLQFMEFLNSVRDGEAFTYDWRGTVATPDNPETVKIVGDYSEQEAGGDNYRFSFAVEVQ
jgi:hypothetical protein